MSLYHQVTNSFMDYLNVMLKLNTMETQINSSITSIRFFRGFSKELQAKFSGKVQHVLTLKRRKIKFHTA